MSFGHLQAFIGNSHEAVGTIIDYSTDYPVLEIEYNNKFYVLQSHYKYSHRVGHVGEQILVTFKGSVEEFVVPATPTPDLLYLLSYIPALCFCGLAKLDCYYN